MNTLHIIGNLTGDPQRRTVNTSRGQATVCDFSVAVNRIERGEKKTQFFKVTLWDRAAENALKYLAKGRKVAVTGPVEGHAYLDKNGEARMNLEIRQVREIDYLSNRSADAQEAAFGENETMPTYDEDELPFG